MIQFYVFKQNAYNSSMFVSCIDENIEKVKMFLDENEEENISCMRYNKCLALVPESKRSFMEIFKHWQPNVIIEKIEEFSWTPKHLKAEIDLKETELNEEDTLAVEEECLDDSNPEETVNEEWIQMEIGSNIESDDGEIPSWLCTDCQPNVRLFDFKEFQVHMSNHNDFEDLVETDYTEASIPEENFPDPNNEILFQFDCVKCGFAANDCNELRIHQKTHFDEKLFSSSKLEKLYCSDCCYQFVSQAHYQAHVNGHQLYAIVAKYSTYPTCDVCNIMFCDESFALDHQKKHEEGRIIDLPIASEGLFLKFGHHRPELDQSKVSLSESSVKCAHCFKIFTDEESCRLHQLIFHVTTLKCPIESRIFNGNQAFSIHMKNNHPDLFVNNNSTPSTRS